MSASFDSYKVFYYVGRYKNITHAAAALFLSQSTVSRDIQSLEAELGCKLFHRTQHGVAFTPEGETLYQHIAKACEQIFIGEEAVLRLQKLSAGKLRIGVSDLVFSHFLLPALGEFNEAYPAADLEIISGDIHSFDSAARALRDGRIDVACIVTSTAQTVSSRDIEAVSLAVFNDIVIASESFAGLKKGSHYLADLVYYPFASLSGSTPQRSHLDELLASNGLQAEPKFRVDSIGMFLSLVKTCKCLAVVPGMFREELTADSGVFEVSMKTPLPARNISVLTLRSAPPSSARDAFVQQLKKSIGEKARGGSGRSSVNI